MQLSAEARLWWEEDQARAVGQWFETLSNVPPGGACLSGEIDPTEPRHDVYVRGLGAELGIKARSAGTENAKTEIKSLVASCGDAPPCGPVTIWTKVAAPSLTLDQMPSIRTTKYRRLRKFGWSESRLEEIALDEQENPRNGYRPHAGCNVELTRVRVENLATVWWTLGYEAFGNLNEIERILPMCLLETLGRSPLPARDSATPGSYPQWLIREGLSD
ncbi:MAG: hypothetical protein WCZ66_07675 [Sphingomonadaceae bacterium]